MAAVLLRQSPKVGKITAKGNLTVVKDIDYLSHETGMECACECSNLAPDSKEMAKRVMCLAFLQ
jgi:hypothetical protein